MVFRAALSRFRALTQATLSQVWGVQCGDCHNLGQRVESGRIPGMSEEQKIFAGSSAVSPFHQTGKMTSAGRAQIQYLAKGACSLRLFRLMFSWSSAL